MTSSWDVLQEKIKAEMRKLYSETVIEHNLNPRNIGSFENADGYAEFTGTCGDTMEMWLEVKDDKVVRAGFTTDGCGTTIACGSMVTELATGKKINEAMKINHADILLALDGLPEESEHCAMLAAMTLKAAIKNYLEIKDNPWKKLYRNK